jgi:hypothetical protein
LFHSQGCEWDFHSKGRSTRSSFVLRPGARLAGSRSSRSTLCIGPRTNGDELFPSSTRGPLGTSRRAGANLRAGHCQLQLLARPAGLLVARALPHGALLAGLLLARARTQPDAGLPEADSLVFTVSVETPVPPFSPILAEPWMLTRLRVVRSSPTTAGCDRLERIVTLDGSWRTNRIDRFFFVTTGEAFRDHAAIVYVYSRRPAASSQRHNARDIDARPTESIGAGVAGISLNHVDHSRCTATVLTYYLCEPSEVLLVPRPPRGFFFPSRFLVPPASASATNPPPWPQQSQRHATNHPKSVNWCRPPRTGPCAHCKKAANPNGASLMEIVPLGLVVVQDARMLNLLTAYVAQENFLEPRLNPVPKEHSGALCVFKKQRDISPWPRTRCSGVSAGEFVRR